MSALRLLDTRIGDELAARLTTEHRALADELGDELPARLVPEGGACHAQAWFRAERFGARDANPARAWEQLTAALRAAAPQLSGYVDVQEYICSVRPLRVGAAGVELGAPTQRFNYRLSRPEACARLELTTAPFLMFKDDETGEDALLFALPGGERLLFLESPELFELEELPARIAVPCLQLDAAGATLGERAPELSSATFTTLEGLVADAQRLGVVLVRHPETGLLAVVLAAGEGALLCEYLFEDRHVDRARMEGFAPREDDELPRSWKDQLACPACRAALPNPDEAALVCAACERSFELAPTGAPHLLLPEDTPEELEQDEEWIPNNAPKVLHYFLCKYPRGLVLDAGAGSNPIQAPNLVNLEVFAFEKTTVVGSGERLPFVDGAFDAAMSSAVLEHVPDPPAYCEELARVVRSGGEARIDSAFLQPYHACPDHYYGTTLSGLRLASRAFEEVAAGNSDSQSPFVALQVWLHAYAANLPEEHRARFYASSVSELVSLPPGRGPGYVRIPPEHSNKLASGVYRHVRKP